MRTPPRAEPPHTISLAVVAATTTLVLLAFGGGRAAGTSDNPSTTWRGLVGGARPRVSLGQRMLVVLASPSLADHVGASGGRATDKQERRWTNRALLQQKLLISQLAVQGVVIRRDFSFARVLNGFSAALDARAIALLERSPQVAGVYPVRSAYPASSASTLLSKDAFKPGMGHRPDVALPGFDGRGVTVALLDTGVDRSQPFLRTRVTDGADVVGGDPLADAASKPDDTGELERHGTELAGIVVGDGGPAGLSGVATGATIMPIRVAGWQPDATGGWAVYARTDQLVAGLERAVDPNQDGDAHDAARIALVGVAEPYAAFADGASARAAAGAARLDTLVVAPAGNDGAAGPGFGSISGPGGAPAVLTVGAADLRRQTEQVRVVLRAGLNVVFDRIVPLGGAVSPRGPLSLRVAVPREAAAGQRGIPTASAALTPFFDRRGYSVVAGRAALLRAGDDPERAVQTAARAGAAAILLYGDRLPPGAFGFEQTAAVPVVGLAPDEAQALLDALARHESVGVSIGVARRRVNAGAGRVAPFSSTGLAFDGRVKPEIVAAGVGTATADPGRDEDGAARYGTVNGTSAAAAAVAGAAALLAQARPSLDATDLKSLLVSTARPLRRDAVTAQGAGLVDAGAAAAAEIAVTPASLALGQATGAGWKTSQTLVLRNVSTRTLHVAIEVRHASEGAAAVIFEPRPRTVTLLRGQGARIRFRISVASAPLGVAPATGTIVLRQVGGGILRVPWAITFDAPVANLLGPPHLSTSAFSPSDSAPALLTFQAGLILHTAAGDAVRPLDRLDIELWSDSGADMGVLARIRDVLPGSYAVGLTGRDPAGAILPAGVYHLRLLGFPTGRGPVSRRSLAFTIK